MGDRLKEGIRFVSSERDGQYGYCGGVHRPASVRDPFSEWLETNGHLVGRGDDAKYLVYDGSVLFTVSTWTEIVDGTKGEIGRGPLSLGPCKIKMNIRIESSPSDVQIPTGLKAIIDSEGFLNAFS